MTKSCQNCSYYSAKIDPVNYCVLDWFCDCKYGEYYGEIIGRLECCRDWEKLPGMEIT